MSDSTKGQTRSRYHQKRMCVCGWVGGWLSSLVCDERFDSITASLTEIFAYSTGSKMTPDDIV